MSIRSARDHTTEGHTIEIIEVTLVLYKLLQQDANEEGVIKNGLLPDEYVMQLHTRLMQRYSEAVTLSMVTRAFIALQQLGLRKNARGLYRNGMEVSRRQIFLDSPRGETQRGVDQFAIQLDMGVAAKDSEELQQR